MAKQDTFRRLVLARDRFTCRRCRRGPLPANKLEANHIIPLWAGGTFDIENGETLCLGCHRDHSNNVRRKAIAWRVRNGRKPTEAHPGLIART